MIPIYSATARLMISMNYKITKFSFYTYLTLFIASQFTFLVWVCGVSSVCFIIANWAYKLVVVVPEVFLIQSITLCTAFIFQEA